jgi:hypothetical protein
MPSSSAGIGQSALGGSMRQPETLVKCATSPPQYRWIYKGACDPHITLKRTGTNFSLAAYESITVKGSIGYTNSRGTASLAVADATDTNGDITTYEGKAFPKYTRGAKPFIYVVAVNQSDQIIKPIPRGSKPVLQSVITDARGLPGTTCGAALLSEEQNGRFVWISLPARFKVRGKTVTITQRAVPRGFEIPPKTPLYFGVNCWTA